MLSVLILAAVTAIAFSLATIVFIELRSSSDVLRSEPALYATLGVTEEAIFQYKRFVNERSGGTTVNPPLLDVSTCLPTKMGVCDLNGVDLSSPPAESLQEEAVPLVATVDAGKSLEIPLYYLDNPNCTPGDTFCDWQVPFSKLELQRVPVGATDATLTARMDWIDQDSNTGTINIGQLSEGAKRLSWTTFNSLSRHTLVLTNNSQQNNMQVSIWSYTGSGLSQVEKGLPITAKRVLKIIADYAGLTRTYRVEIPFGNLDFGDPTANDVVWFDDSTPAGAVWGYDGGDSWNWVANPKFSGNLAHQSALAPNTLHQHYFVNATATMVVNTGDTLITYVYLDPTNPPSEVMLQWNNGIWDHRAYWGSDDIPWGTNGTDSRRYMGALPATGQWVRLEVPASSVGLEGSVINGAAFTLFGGQATWDYVGRTP